MPSGGFWDDLVEFDIPEEDVKIGKRVIVPSKDPNGMTPDQIKEIQVESMDSDRIVLNVGSGDYHFEF